MTTYLIKPTNNKKKTTKKNKIIHTTKCYFTTLSEYDVFGCVPTNDTRNKLATFEVISYISNTIDCVSTHFQTLRRELNIRRAEEYF